MYDYDYNDYLYEKTFSDAYDYYYYDQREFAMSPAEMAKLLYREKRGLMGKGAYADKLAQKQIAKLEDRFVGLKPFKASPKTLSREANFNIENDKLNSTDVYYRRGNNRALRNKDRNIEAYTKRLTR